MSRITELFFFILCAGVISVQAGGVQFDRTFAPQAGLVCQYEMPARDQICLNGTWRFQGDENTAVPGGQLSAPDHWDQTPIKIPSPWNVNSFVMNSRVQGGDFCAYPSYPKSWEKLSAAWMEKTLKVPAAWNGKRTILRFGAVAGKMVVYVNGQYAGEASTFSSPKILT
jgi:beta-galactosidase/beta-glucuronidase